MNADDPSSKPSRRTIVNGLGSGIVAAPAVLAGGQALAQAGALASMSRRANCYDNAFMESFWSTLKLELVYRVDFATHQQARSELFDYIENFYNRQRAHSALNYLSPVDFQTQNN